LESKIKATTKLERNIFLESEGSSRCSMLYGLEVIAKKLLGRKKGKKGENGRAILRLGALLYSNSAYREA